MSSLTRFLNSVSLANRFDRTRLFVDHSGRACATRGSSDIKMVYCGKPSRGCQMCRTRRIKVRQPYANASPAPQALALSRCPPDVSCSAMRLSLLVFNARSLDANVQDIRMTSTLSFVTKPKPRRGGLAGQSTARRSNFRLDRGTATKLTVRLWLQAAVAK